MSKSKVVKAASLLTLFALTACGQQQFKVTDSTTQAVAPGHYSIPPKIDILLAEDDTGSMFSLYDSIKTQTPAFLQGLENSGWDFHFAVTPLTSQQAMNQVAGSKYDPANGDNWVAPYPGAPNTNVGGITPLFFKTLLNFSGFLAYGQINNNLNGLEPGLSTIWDAAHNRATGTGFHRNDALLVMLVFGNGNDTSGVNYCHRAVDNLDVPCNDNSATTSFNTYKANFQTLRPNPSQVKMYSVVAKSNSNNCLGQHAYAGDRYIQMASQLGGASYDVCSNSVSSVLAGITSQLKAQKMSFRTRYLVIPEDADVNSITVTKNGSPLSRDSANGWTYLGGPQTVYTIDAPVLMNQVTGYIIELHGDAKLLGDDAASVNYKPAGATNSH